MSHPAILDSKITALVVVDVQEAFRNAIPDFAVVASRVSMAVRGFLQLGLPIVVTEQYTAGLGPTAEEIRLSLPDDYKAVEKTAFSACAAEEFIDQIEKNEITQIVLCGLETHICVSQTAHDLLERGLRVHVLTDSVCSRFEHDKQAGLAKMQAAGVVPSSVEMALFELLRDSSHDQFKEIQKLIK